MPKMGMRPMALKMLRLGRYPVGRRNLVYRPKRSIFPPFRRIFAPLGRIFKMRCPAIGAWGSHHFHTIDERKGSASWSRLHDSGHSSSLATPFPLKGGKGRGWGPPTYPYTRKGPKIEVFFELFFKNLHFFQKRG